MHLSAFALKLLTNLSFHACWLIRRVKAKSAITLELNQMDMQNRHLALCHSRTVQHENHLTRKTFLFADVATK